MTRLLITTTAVAFFLAGSATCQTPQYPVRQGYTPPPPIQPKYPVREQSPPTDQTPTATSDASTTSAAPTAAPVESQSLAPAAGSAPMPEASSPPAETPAYSPPSASETRPAAYKSPLARFTAEGKVVTPKGMYRSYVVRKGDHLDAIAADLQSSRKELAEANHLKSPYDLNPGQHIKVSVAKAYEAQSGDTMTAVAKRFGVGVGDLADLNDLPAKSRLKPGMLIALPAGYEDHGPVRLPATTYAEAEPRQTATPRAAPRRSIIEQPGPYVPSRAALAAGEAKRAEMAQSGASTPSYSPPPYRATPSPSPANQAAIVASGQGRFVWPIRGDVISGFGVTGVGRRNDGVDIRAPQGTVVHAAAAGDVVYAGNQVPGFGDLVLVKHADGWVTAYAHLDKISVQMRQTVMQGDELGEVGTSGGVSEPQLHFEIRYASSPADKAKPLDPLLLLPK